MSLLDMLEDAWGGLVDGFGYVFGFEWLEDVGEFFGSMFENIGEFSFLGLTFGVLSVGFSYATKFLNFTGADKQMTLIASMVQYMPPTQRIVWSVLSYVGAFVAGYFVGKHFENT